MEGIDAHLPNQGYFFDKLTMKEGLLELRIIKKTFIGENTNILNEITKKQRQILECFKLDITEKLSY